MEKINKPINTIEEMLGNRRPYPILQRKLIMDICRRIKKLEKSCYKAKY